MRSQLLPRPLLVTGLLLACVVTASSQQPLDLVIAGGRAIDSESGLDAPRNIGIRGDRIVAVSADALQGRETIDARGLVVAPGFIDIHRHAHGDASYRYAARDGVTSVFEIEIGTADVDAWYRAMGPARLINFGVASGHIGARMQVLGDRGFLLPTGPGRGEASEAQVAEILTVLEAGLVAGGVAIGIGPAYTPGVNAAELEAVFRLAARHGAFVLAHTGGGAANLPSLMRLASTTKTSLHVAHVNSTAGAEIRRWLDGIRAARDIGVDVTTEMYPYTASATLIQSALYDGWESWPDERFAQLQWPASGSRARRSRGSARRAVRSSRTRTRKSGCW